MNKSGLAIDTVFSLGPVAISTTVVTTWFIMICLALFSIMINYRLKPVPDRIQIIVEGAIGAINAAVQEAAPGYAQRIMPFIGSIWIFLVIANLIGLVPGLHSPTRDLSATAALAIMVFLSVHWFGIRSQGLKNYLRHYLTPSPILLPFHIISEITRTVALAIRLFGNMMSLEMAAILILLVAGFLAPIPILMLHIIEALVQAYIFGMLALIYVAGGLQSQQNRQQKDT
jgi:F-type H+-transporting ATPase subunit a